MTVVGGFTSNKAPDAEVTALVEGVKGDVEKRLETTFDKFEPHSVQTQVASIAWGELMQLNSSLTTVAGLNYKVKVHVGDDKFVHVTVHKPLPHKNEAAKLLSAEAGKTLEDEL